MKKKMKIKKYIKKMHKGPERRGKRTRKSSSQPLFSACFSSAVAIESIRVENSVSASSMSSAPNSQSYSTYRVRK